MTTLVDRPDAPSSAVGYRTVAAMVREWAEKIPDAVAMREKDYGIWQETTWREYWDTVLDAAHALLALGVAEGDRVSIHSEDRPEWVEGTTAFAEEAGAQYPAGVLVNEILPNSAYEQGGGQVNDVIVFLDDVPIRTLDELLTTLRMRRADQQVVIGVVRADADLEIDVTLGRLDV